MALLSTLNDLRALLRFYENKKKGIVDGLKKITEKEEVRKQWKKI